uniref:CCHC-type domain-containing protein n=1 Tax=Fagus sylvatica TaxID=28930 RepID=A0A2N9HD04_FAGSY
MLWKFQITSTLKAYKLLDVVDGSYPCPEMYTRDSNGAVTAILNPEFTLWDTKDQALISMISATLSPSALALVIGQKSAKGKLKECKDKLEAVGVFIEDEELLHIILDGLPTEFYPFCSTTRTINEPITFEELLVLMLAEEKSLKHNIDSSKELMHLAMLGTGPKPNTGTNTSPAIPFNPQSNRGGRGGRYNNYRGGRGGRNFNNNNNKGGFSFSPSSSQPSTYANNQFSFSRPSCRICYKMGHTALDCYHIMNFSFQGKHPPTKLAAMAFSSNASSSNCWVSDTGATDHFTLNLANIQQAKVFPSHI